MLAIVIAVYVTGMITVPVTYYVADESRLHTDPWEYVGLSLLWWVAILSFLVTRLVDEYDETQRRRDRLRTRHKNGRAQKREEITHQERQDGTSQEIE
jgi:hypothetical protein